MVLVAPKPDLRKSKAVSYELWDMARKDQKSHSSITDDVAKVKKIVTDTLAKILADTNCMNTIVEVMKTNLNDKIVEKGRVNDLNALFVAVSTKCIDNGQWCEITETEGTLLAPTNGFDEDKLHPNITKYFDHTAPLQAMDQKGGAAATTKEQLLTDKLLRQLFDVFVVTGELDGNKIKSLSAILSVRTEFVRALEICTADGAKYDKAQPFMQFYRAFAQLHHLNAAKAALDTKSVYDIHTDVNVFNRELVLANAMTGEKCDVHTWLKSSKNNLIFTLNTSFDSFQKASTVKRLNAAHKFSDIKKLGFATDWQTIRSSVPYVECLDQDQPRNKIRVGDHDKAVYAKRQYMNTGDRQFLLCIKERDNMTIVIFITETLFMKLANYKHNNHPGQIFELKTYIHDADRFDHPVHNSMFCTSRQGQIILVATDVSNVSFFDVKTEYVTRDEIMRVTGQTEQGIMMHQIFEHCYARSKKANEMIQEILTKLQNDFIDEANVKAAYTEADTQSTASNGAAQNDKLTHDQFIAAYKNIQKIKAKVGELSILMTTLKD